MRKFGIFGLSVILFMSTMNGCTWLNGNGNTNGNDNVSPPNLEDHVDDIARFTELATRIAFTNEQIAANKEQVCLVVSDLTSVLANYEDPDATFDSLRVAAVASLNNALLNYPQIDGNLRAMIVLGVEQILDSAFDHVKGKYSDAISNEPVRSVLIVSKAVSEGINNACLGTQSMGSFSVERN